MTVLPEEKWPKELIQTLESANEDATVSKMLSGPDKLLSNEGLYYTWSAVGRMDQVSVPT